jgi:hypothetical protein
MGGGFRWCDLRIIGLCLSRPHCSSSYGVSTLQGLVGGGWGRRRGNWSRKKGRGLDFFLPVGNNGKRDKAIDKGL